MVNDIEITVRSVVQKTIKFTFAKKQNGCVIATARYGKSHRSFLFTRTESIEKCCARIYEDAVIWIDSIAFDVSEADARRVAETLGMFISEAA